MMRERVLRHFLMGEADTTELVQALTTESESGFHYQFMDMDSVYLLSREDLLRLCDAVQQGELDLSLLPLVGEWLVRSDQFEWPEDETMADICYQWMEAKAPLTLAQIKSERQQLKEPTD